MQSIFSAIFVFLITLPVISAAQETGAAGAPPVIEPLSTGYLVVLGLITFVVVGGICWYYMRWDNEGDKQKPK